ncbi:DUF943 family protein [Pantoea sp. CCBC3-3-1]|uniref:DUF943 family protein n=1 Tax=Pantoea sp. CCBC3-3-1 TaxID=2490851 RepID=UPI0011BDA041|nr:DUF943 family protein [Pantoea sp. CCBC3-3-1]
MIKHFVIMLIIIICVCAAWHTSRPVEIIAVHDGNTILVKNFPIFKNKQIAWWESNKEMIKNRYDIPRPDEEGYYAIYVQGFGDGYHRDGEREEDADLLCFKDMPVEAHCINKDPLLTIGNARNAPSYFE